MLRKNQLRKQNAAQLIAAAESSLSQHDLQIYSECITDRADLLTAKRTELEKRLNKSRLAIVKAGRDFKEAMRDRLELVRAQTYDRNSRPTEVDVSELTELFEFMQLQDTLAHKNYETLKATQSVTDASLKSITIPNSSKKSQQLDEEYLKLRQLCQKEEITFKQLEKDRQERLVYYSQLQKQIESCRLQYDKVEEGIRLKETQLDHLKTYLKDRKAEDEQKVSQEHQRNHILEADLLTSQERLNANTQKGQDLSALVPMSSISKGR